MKGEGTQRLSIAEKASGELGRDVLCVRRRATVAAHEQGATGRHRPGDDPDHAIHVGGESPDSRGDAEVLVAHRLDGSLMAHFTVHVRTPGSTNVRLTSWPPALRSASCTAYRRRGAQANIMNPPPPAPFIFPPSAPA